MTFAVSTLCLASGAPLLFRSDSHILRGLGAALFSVGFVMERFAAGHPRPT